MKRFKVQYLINGQNCDLYAEPMDMNRRMYSLERENLPDPHPLLIERQENGSWKVTSQDNWSLNAEEVNELGELLDKEYPTSPQQ